MQKSCFYTIHPAGRSKIEGTGTCYAFVSHTFAADPVAAAVIEDDKTGKIVIAKAEDVRFSISGNMDKR